MSVVLIAMGSVHKTDDFFKHWNLYQKIIQNDYMSHNEIFHKIHDYMKNNFNSPYKMTEVGCGDASHVCKHLTDIPPDHYYGVDMSKMALGIANTNLEQTKFKNNTLVNSDLVSYLKNAESTTDVILAGYCMHHLDYDEKQAAFDLCFDHLNDNGILIMYDLIRGQDESRKDAIDRYMKNCRKEWSNLSSDELDSIYQHMMHNDYHETQEDMVLCLQKSRFKINQTVMFEDGAVALFIMSKQV